MFLSDIEICRITRFLVSMINVNLFKSLNQMFVLYVGLIIEKLPS